MSYTKHIVKLANGRRVAFILNLGATGKIDQIFIWLHGIGERGNVPANDTDYGTVGNIANYGIPFLVKASGANIPLYSMPGGNPSKLYSTGVIAPQLHIDYGTWPFDFTYRMIDYIRYDLAGVVPYDRVHLCGHSLGGGGCLSISHMPKVHQNIASIWTIAAGYNNNQNYPLMAKDGPPITLFQTLTDGYDFIPGVNDGYVNNLQAQKPISMVRHLRFSGATTGTKNHNDIVVTVCKGNPSGQQFALTNGDMWVHNRPIYQEALSFTLNHMKKAA